MGGKPSLLDPMEVDIKGPYLGLDLLTAYPPSTAVMLWGHWNCLPYLISLSVHQHQTPLHFG